MKQQSIRQSLCFWQSIKDKNRGTLEQRLDHQSAMTDHEVSFNHIAALRGMVHNHFMNKLEDINIKFARAEEWMSEVTRETDRRSREMCTSIS